MFTPPYSQLAREHAVSVPQGALFIAKVKGRIQMHRASASGPRSHVHLGFCAAAKDVEAKL